MLARRLLFLSFVLTFAFAAIPLVTEAQTALQFVSVVPCRVADTRNAPGQFGGPAITGGTHRDFVIPQSACNIPGSAAAYSLNVTVVPPGPLGYLTMWPAGQTMPVLSTLNSVDGRVKANAAIVPAGQNGAISIFASNTTHVVLDIDGYFAPATGSTLAFFPLTSCRVADTRGPNGPLGGPYLQGQAPRIFPVLSSSCTIPISAQAYSLNFTVVPRNGQPLGYLTVWPTGQSQPVVSTLNSMTGTVVANAAIVPNGNQGAISVFASNDTDLVIDVDGYLAPSTSGSNPLSLYTLAPCRVLDTRQSSGMFTGMLPVEVLENPCGVPSAEAYVLNATVVPQGPLGYLTLWPDAEGQPVVSTLNSMDGQVTSNMAIVPTLNGAIDAFASNPTQLVMDISSYFATIAQLSITATSLPSGTVNYNYNAPLGAMGGVTPYKWSIVSGNLPPNLGLDPGSGVISGTATMAGSYPFTVQVADSQSPPATASAPFSITINSTLTQLTITTASLPSGTQNAPYSAMLAATGGLTPYTWSIAGGSLPGGLSLNSSTGAIAGTPTGGGISNFTVKVTDSEQSPASASAPLSITINPAVPLSITTKSLPNGVAGVTYSSPISAIGGVYPYTWSITAGKLPKGFSLNPSTGLISGAPSVVGTSNSTAQVTDSETPPVNATAQLSITINPGVVKITTTLLPNGVAGQPYSATLTATGGVIPYSWNVVSGKVPDGLTFDSSTGAITGTPQNVGTSYLTFQVTDSETPPVNATTQLGITITSPGGSGDPGALKGNYAFYLNGFNSAGQWTFAGSFISDGKGSITSGVVDGNSVTGQPFNTTINGSYSIWNTGLNTITIQGQSWGPVTFAFVLNSNGSGRIIEYDDTTGYGSRASGVLRKQDPAAFSLSRLNGGWVYGMTGADGSAAHMANVGQFTLAAGNISNGSCDMNDGGDYQTCTFIGTVSAVDAQTGRAVVTAQSNHGTSHEAVYAVSTSELVMESIDLSQGQNGSPMEVGSVLKQSGPFSNASLNGNAVMYFQDVHCGDGLDQSGAAILSFDGNGNGNSIAMDEDLAGTITQDSPQLSTYSVQSNGAASFFCQNGGCPTGFLVSQNKGFFVGEGCSSMFVTIEPQTGGPFSNASIAGVYSGGSVAPLDYANAQNEVDVISADGRTTLTVSGDSDNPGSGIDQWFGALANYNIAANGRGTMPGETGVIYVISPTKWLVLQPKTGADLDVFEHWF
jgi:hypothetical protein